MVVVAVVVRVAVVVAVVVIVVVIGYCCLLGSEIGVDSCCSRFDFCAISFNQFSSLSFLC